MVAIAWEIGSWGPAVPTSSTAMDVSEDPTTSGGAREGRVKVGKGDGCVASEDPTANTWGTEGSGAERMRCIIMLVMFSERLAVSAGVLQRSICWLYS